MGISIFIAKVLGLSCVIISAGFIFNRETYKQFMEDFTKNRALIFYGGLLSLVVGLLIVLSHNLWGMSWVVLITIFGWGGVIKGIWLLVFPDTVSKFVDHYRKNEILSTIHPIIVLVFGIALTVFGFFIR